MYLLDTNIVSYFLKGRDMGLHQRMAQALRGGQASISVLSYAEIRYGQALMAGDDKRHPRINLFLKQIPALPWTVAAAEQFGRIKARNRQQGRLRGDMDTLIAAHAIAENLVLVTHNTRHFTDIPGLRLEDWVGSLP